jgi:UDP-N-acetylglucosamine acyltransferase
VSNIHSTAIIHEGAELASDVTVGPYSIIGPNIKIDTGCEIQSHVILEGHTTIGKNNRIFHFSSIGTPPQDMTYKDEPTETIIGDNNIFREYVSIHRGTLKENKKTVVGSNCMLMAHVHLGHDVVVGDNCIFANSVNLAGHVKIGDRVIIGGGTNISQFVRIGTASYLGGATAIDRDIPVYATGYGNRVKLKGINIVGLRRLGVSRQDITELVDFYRLMESSALSPRAFVDEESNVDEFKDNTLVKEMIDFIQTSKIGLAPFI